MTEVNEKLYHFTIDVLTELTDAMRMVCDQTMKHNGNTSSESQFLVIANGLSQLDASINGIRRQDIKVHSGDMIAPDESHWSESALVVDPCSLDFMLDKLDDLCDELKNQIKTQDFGGF